MPAAESPPTEEAGQARTDPVELAARAILGYLDDLVACRELCLHYEGSVGVVPDPHALHLVVAAELTPECDLARVRAAVEALPSAGRWRGEPAAENGDETAGGRKVIARHVLWEGEPLHVAVAPEGFGLLRVELIFPHRPEFSILPLRAVASALRCLERLLPPCLARAVPLSELAAEQAAEGLSVWMRRATPENLPSGQCIWPAEEEQSPAPPSLPLHPHEP
ncbi:MAG: hypothetical protein ACRC33_24300 [Gemmataceae bacterium]